MSKKAWIVFGVVQCTGLVLPHFANVHTNPLPLVLGAILLLPGNLVDLADPKGDHDELLTLAAISINALTWYLLARLLSKFRTP